MNEREFQINGITFQLSKLDPWKQFHVVRKLAPFMADLLPTLAKFSALTPDELKGDQMEALAPALNSLAKMSQSDSEFCVKTLISCVAMKQDSGNYAQLIVNDVTMFKDILDLPLMLKLAGKAFMYNLGSFISASPQLSTGPK